VPVNVETVGTPGTVVPLSVGSWVGGSPSNTVWPGPRPIPACQVLS